MNRISITFSSFAIAALMAVAPLVAFADTDASKGVVISASGNVNVVGASVTAVSSTSISAATALGSTTINWTVNTSPSTKIEANGVISTSTSGIVIGDKINFSGTLSSFGSTITVAASRIRDTSSYPNLNGAAGKITSINATSSSFVLSIGRHNVTVQTNASTAITVNGVSTSTFASLQVGQQVKVTGTLNSGGTVIIASNVLAITSGNSTRIEAREKAEQKREKAKELREEAKQERETKNSANFFLNLFSKLRVN
ncbi:MAG: DUF5666 domain-containing protein [bacterium]|nr:DUF5666 domain-containing protein [bacterium]